MNKNYLLRACGALLTAITCASCANVSSDDVTPKATSADYSASYEENTQAIYYSANFTAGQGIGTSITLTGKAAIAVSGQSMTMNHNLFGESIYGYSIPVQNASDL